MILSQRSDLDGERGDLTGSRGDNSQCGVGWRNLNTVTVDLAIPGRAHTAEPRSLWGFTEHVLVGIHCSGFSGTKLISWRWENAKVLMFLFSSLIPMTWLTFGGNDRYRWRWTSLRYWSRRAAWPPRALPLHTLGPVSAPAVHTGLGTGTSPRGYTATPPTVLMQRKQRKTGFSQTGRLSSPPSRLFRVDFKSLSWISPTSLSHLCENFLLPLTLLEVVWTNQRTVKDCQISNLSLRRSSFVK